MDFVRTLGADHVLDYTQEDVTKNRKRYDLIFDIAAYRSISENKRILSSGGIYVVAGGSMARIFQVMLRSTIGFKNMKIIVGQANQKDLSFIGELMTSGQVKSRIDKCFPLNETAEAIRYLEDGHASGKVVITV